jgi:murein DD-endopeptidase MepM/ murein hydrolase activator NlpD
MKLMNEKITFIFNNIAGIILCVLIAPAVTPLPEKLTETISYDNAVFQHYAGKTGRWVYAADKDGIEEYTDEFGSDMRETEKINRGSAGPYMFIPYGEQYIETLANEGLRETMLKSAPGEWTKPLDSAMRISSGFGYRETGFHNGIDIPAERGTIVHATRDGIVTFAAFNGGYGYMVDVTHLDGYMTRYGHNSAVLVHQGDFVRKGQIIALSGSTGNSTGSHLHYEIRLNDMPVNPLEHLPSEIRR